MQSIRTLADKEQTIVFYDKNAKTYEEYRKSTQEICEKFANLVGKNGQVLDVGCGAGADMLIMQSLGLCPIGMDASIGMVKIAWQHGLSVYLTDFESREFWEILWLFYRGLFDGVWSRNALCHTAPQNLVTIVKMARKLLRKKGILFLGMKESKTPEIDEENKTTEHGTTYYCYWPRKQLINTVQQIGFELNTLTVPGPDSFGERNLLEMFFIKK